MSAEATGWVWKNSPWKGHHHKFVLHLAVADVVNDANDNEFWMSQRNLAEKAGVCLRSTSEWLGEAVSTNVMTLVQDNSRAGKPNLYRLNLPDSGGKHAVPTRSAQDAYPGKHAVPTKQKEELKNSSNYIAKIVLEAWVEATGRDRTRTRLNAKRISAVQARLNEGYTLEDLVGAVRGIAQSRWHMGDNPGRKRYDDMLVAIRDGERVEKFRDLDAQGGDQPELSATDAAVAALESSRALALEAGDG